MLLNDRLTPLAPKPNVQFDQDYARQFAFCSAISLLYSAILDFKR